MQDSNGIIDAHSASPLAPDLVAALSDEDFWSLASSPLPCNQKYTMRSKARGTGTFGYLHPHTEFSVFTSFYTVLTDSPQPPVMTANFSFFSSIRPHH